MASIIGNIIVIAAVLFVFIKCGKNWIEMIKGELSGKGCAGCSGGCSGHCSGGCSGCNSKR